MAKIIKANRFQLVFWLLTGIIGFLAYREFLQTNVLAYVGTQNIWSSRRFIVFLIFSAISLLAYFSVWFLNLKEKYKTAFSRLREFSNWFKYLLVTLLVLLPGLLKWTLPLPENFNIGFWTEFFLIYILSGFSAVVFSTEEESGWLWVLRAGSLILLAGAAHSILYKLNSITSYPFTLHWSEGNRFYDYSTLFGSFRYLAVDGDDIKAFVSWGMQLPWALPFIFPKISIAFYRFWYQLVWIIPSLALGLVSIWQTRKNKKLIWFIIVLAFWAYLFLDQGPIYAPLVIGAVLTVIAVRLKLLPGMLLVFLASYYTSSARWTWSFAPGIWAGLISLLAVPQPSLRREDWPKLVKPIALVLVGYLGGQFLPSIIRKIKSDEVFRLLPNPVASTTRQPLLWSRLYPNPTFPPGVLGGLLWATMPLVLVLLVLIVTKKWRVNWLQKITLFIIPAIFLVVGIFASVKIGGGSNLHNLDMFIISLFLVASAAITNFNKSGILFEGFSPFINLLIFIAIVSPVTYGMIGGERLILPSDEKISESVAAVQNKVEEFSQKGEILFIDHRQLLTFNLVKNVPLIDDYEKKYLMDKALSGNSSYFNAFYKDLNNMRFALIVNEPANIIIRGSEYSFGEENDAYVKWVTKPILCTYEPIYTSFDTNLELLVPRKIPPPDEMKCEEILNP